MQSGFDPAPQAGRAVAGRVPTPHPSSRGTPCLRVPQQVLLGSRPAGAPPGFPSRSGSAARRWQSAGCQCPCRAGPWPQSGGCKLRGVGWVEWGWGFGSLAGIVGHHRRNVHCKSGVEHRWSQSATAHKHWHASRRCCCVTDSWPPHSRTDLLCRSLLLMLAPAQYHVNSSHPLDAPYLSCRCHRLSRRRRPLPSRCRWEPPR